MSVSTKSRCQLASNLQSLPAEQIKKAIIELLSTENIELIDLEQGLSKEITSFRKWIKNQRRV